MPRYRARLTAPDGQQQSTFFHAESLDAARGVLSTQGHDAAAVAELLEVPELPPHGSPPKGDATGGLIPYKNMHALLAYYLGLFSLLPLIGLALAIPAVILGVIGLRNVKREPEVKGTVHAWIGIVMGGLFTLIWGAAVVLMFVAVINGF